MKFLKKFPCLVIYLVVFAILAVFVNKNPEYGEEGIFGILFASLGFTAIYAILVNFMGVKFWNQLFILGWITVTNFVFTLYISIIEFGTMMVIVTMCAIIAQYLYMRLMFYGKQVIRNEVGGASVIESR